MDLVVRLAPNAGLLSNIVCEGSPVVVQHPQGFRVPLSI